MTCLLAVLAMLIAASPSALAAPGEEEAHGLESLLDSFGEIHPAFVHVPIMRTAYFGGKLVHV